MTHVTCAREHYRSYHLAMRKTVRGTTRSSSSSTREEEGPADAEEGSSWMADHAMLVHGGTSSADPTQGYEFLVLGSNQKPLYRHLEESVRIKTAKTKGILILGRGNRRKTVRINKNILNRKLENFPPFFLSMGGGEDYQ